MRAKILMKEWIYRRACDEARKYNIYPDVCDESRDAQTRAITADADGYVAVIGEVMKETEKALYVNLESGAVVGNSNGWKTWIPKSQIKKEA